MEPDTRICSGNLHKIIYLLKFINAVAVNHVSLCGNKCSLESEEDKKGNCPELLSLAVCEGHSDL